MRKPTFQEMAHAGFHFSGARAWIDGNVPALAQDAALVTTPNTTVPVEFTAYIDPLVVEILTGVRNARAVFEEVKKGDWTTSFEKWRADEIVGTTQPYSDYQSGTTSDVNSNWIAREQYVFQTTIKYGDREVDMAAQAKIELAASKQRAAATIIDIDANKFYLLGVAGKNIYGILNDPNLPSAGKATDYNVSVLDMLNKYFSSLEVVVIPELHSQLSGETIFMIAPEVNGTPTGQLAFGDKMRMGRVIPEMSSFRQKVVATTYGGLVYQPFAFASITGMA